MKPSSSSPPFIFPQVLETHLLFNMPLVNNTLPKRGFDIIAAKINDASLDADANYKPPVTKAEKRKALKAKSLIATKLVNSHFKAAAPAAHAATTLREAADVEVA